MMKQILFIYFFLMSISCSTMMVENSTDLNGIWILEDVVFTDSIQTILKKHVLTIDQNNYKELLFEDTTLINNQQGTLSYNIDNRNIEFVTIIDYKQKIYKGYLSDTGLMIASINGKLLNPPILYKRK